MIVLSWYLELAIYRKKQREYLLGVYFKHVWSLAPIFEEFG
jgi:hypothetical protein